jgi:BASS family bile acid:Na+ symporter
MVMLFFAFLGIRFNWRIFKRSHIIIAIANIVLPLIFYLVVLPFGQVLALTAFVCSIPPTAAAAPVLAQFMKTNVEYVTASVIATNPVVAFFIPLILPLLMPVDQPISFMEVLIPVFKVVGTPLLLASIVKRTSRIWSERILNFRMTAFYLFLFNVWIGCGNALHFLTSDVKVTNSFLGMILILTTIICILTFKLGEYLGPSDEKLAGSLALGRKNTMFGLWLAITFVSPMVALGPISYIIIQNAYNSYQILVVEKHQKALST